MRWLKMLYRASYLLLPPIILFVIFQRLDLEELHQRLSEANPWLFAVGICYYPIVVIIASMRWRTTLAAYFAIHTRFTYLLRQYWIGMVIGYFTPGQIGMDSYRVVMAGRRHGHYPSMVAAIFMEKILALLSAVFLVVCLYPLIHGQLTDTSETLDKIMQISYLVTGIAIVGFLGTFAMARHRFTQYFLTLTSHLLNRQLDRLRARLRNDSIKPETWDISKTLFSLTRLAPFLPIFLISLGIQFISALGNHVFFHAVGYDISFSVNLFVTPILYFIFLLPISFGSLGIREGAYILLYGLFGVPPEVAILVSFINLVGIVLNNIIGALLIWANRPAP